MLNHSDPFVALAFDLPIASKSLFGESRKRAQHKLNHLDVILPHRDGCRTNTTYPSSCTIIPTWHWQVIG
eukprot:10033167-Prorocentrum_lima.AAC.1